MLKICKALVADLYMLNRVKDTNSTCMECVKFLNSTRVEPAVHVGKYKKGKMGLRRAKEHGRHHFI